MAFFSVIIPLYNKENFVAATIQSALNQTFTDFEIIVINDGSTDKSAEKVSQISDSRIQLFTTENQGVSAARNFGIEKASGKMIAFLDADDYWFPNHLENLFELGERFPECGMFCTNYERFFNEKNIVKPHFVDVPTQPWKGIVSDFFKSSYVDRIAWTSAVAVPKKVLEKVGNFDTKITLGAGEDTQLWIRIALQYKVAFNNEISARHVLNSENRISLANTLKRSFAKFDEFAEAEKKNLSLKKYLDLYRTEFALKHKIAGDLKTYRYYLQNTNQENIPLKTKLLLKLPVFLLQKLFGFKKFLERKNIMISVYH
ncbi:glycosyltransferase [Flavobacterium sp. NST-5]|uniref:Glycosyltransferase n=1 Tax=Flavobacterium ichthyis TaxID=2698827 RepID=A0ABW9ZB43_9FLAO|nr:glycosyltransferase family A protein [Flavobacterium ichthyis]NBL65330.1 glycosyltransferase [Flavobacterium ichthyis]